SASAGRRRRWGPVPRGREALDVAERSGVADAGSVGSRRETWRLEVTIRSMVGILATAAALTAASSERVGQTNAAGDNAHVIDPMTNKVVGVIEGIEVPHGVVFAPDGERIYITDESLSTLDVVDGKTLKVTKRIKLSGRPNNVAVSKNGAQVYVAIIQAPG